MVKAIALTIMSQCNKFLSFNWIYFLEFLDSALLDEPSKNLSHLGFVPKPCLRGEKVQNINACSRVMNLIFSTCNAFAAVPTSPP